MGSKKGHKKAELSDKIKQIKKLLFNEMRNIGFPIESGYGAIETEDDVRKIGEQIDSILWSEITRSERFIKSEITEEIVEFLRDVKPGEKLRITSGEGDGGLVKEVEDELWKVSKRASISAIIGPIISVEDAFGKRNEGNPYLRLAKSGRAILFCPPCRERYHFKIKGEREVLVESYHLPQARVEERRIERINNPSLVKRYIRHYDATIEVFNLKRISRKWTGHFIYLTDQEIECIKDKLENHPISGLQMKYDFLTYKEAINLLKDLHIFREEMTA